MFRTFVTALVAVAALAACATVAAAEIRTVGGAPSSAPAVAQRRADPAPGAPRHRLQCWQEGRKIIDESGLYDMSANAVGQHRAISFKNRPGGTRTVFLLPVLDALCLVKAEP